MRWVIKSVRFFILDLLKFKFKSTGKKCYVGYGTYIKPRTTFLGKRVYVGNNCHFSVRSLFVDDFTMIASNVAIVGGDHKFDIVGTPSVLTGRALQRGVVIGKDCWIGHGAIILDGVKIGDFSIIGAGSVVTKNVDSFSLYAGVPAKKIGPRFKTLSDNQKHSDGILNY